MQDGAARGSAARELMGGERARSTPLAQLFAPLDHLLQRGGDTRLQIDPATGANQYGCRAAPDRDVLSFASSTATSISQRAFRRLEEARESLMRSALAAGIDAAFDLRMEEMRHELTACLGLQPGEVDVVFSPSGTDSQLHALFLAQAWLGGPVATVVVAADQTGSGTAHTSRGQHFSAQAASGRRVLRGGPIDGMPQGRSIAVPLLDADGRFLVPSDSDGAVLAAVAAACAAGDHVLLQVMDASKFGWHAPSDGCLDEITRRWPTRVQIVVDACQLRLGRKRLKHYLDRQYAVIVTGSKFFTGPGFSGALLIPSRLGRGADAADTVPQSLADYASRSDWPWAWQTLRTRFPSAPNFGQWLRWEAALEEMRGYYAAPDAFRRAALVAFGRAVERLIGASPSLRMLPLRQDPPDVDNEEFDQPTIFPFLIRRDGRDFGLDACTRLYRALAVDMGQDAADSDIAAVRCLIGQPVALGTSGKAALRICAGARLVSETWSPKAGVARANLQREIERVEMVVDKIEWLLADPARLPGEETRRGA